MITEEQLVERFSKIKTLGDLSKFRNWLYENKWNMSGLMWDITTTACDGKKKKLNEELLEKLK